MNELQPVVLEKEIFDSKGKLKTFAFSRFFRSLKFLTQETFSQKNVIQGCCTVAIMSIGTSKWEIKRVILKKLKKNIKTLHMNLQRLAPSTDQTRVARKQAQQLNFPNFLTKEKKCRLKTWSTKSTDWVLRNIGFFDEKSDQIHFLAILVWKKCDPMKFSRNVVIEFSADINLLIETMIAEIKKFVLKRIESVNPDVSYKYALLDELPVSSLRSDESNTILDSRIAFKKNKKFV